MWRPHGLHRATHSHSGTASFSTYGSQTMPMIRSFSSRAYGALRRDCPTCAHRLTNARAKGRRLLPTCLPRRFARKTAFPAISLPSGRFRSTSKTHSGGIPNRFLQVTVSKTLRQSRVAPIIKPHLPERFRYSPRTSRRGKPRVKTASTAIPRVLCYITRIHAWPRDQLLRPVHGLG